MKEYDLDLWGGLFCCVPCIALSQLLLQGGKYVLKLKKRLANMSWKTKKSLKILLFSLMNCRRNDLTIHLFHLALLYILLFSPDAHSLVMWVHIFCLLYFVFLFFVF